MQLIKGCRPAPSHRYKILTPWLCTPFIFWKFPSYHSLTYSLCQKASSQHNVKRSNFNSLSANSTKWSNTPTIRWLLPTNCLNVFDHFVGLAMDWIGLIDTGPSSKNLMCQMVFTFICMNKCKFEFKSKDAFRIQSSHSWKPLTNFAKNSILSYSTVFWMHLWSHSSHSTSHFASWWCLDQLKTHFKK